MALTNAQLRDHAGRIFLQGVASIIGSDGPISHRTILSSIRNHITDSQFSNDADRREAAIRFLREIYMRTTGRNSEQDAVNRRIFRKWLDGEFGYGVGITIEPLGA